MFATKMVCFIQKLLGRDDDTTTDETGDDETLSLGGQESSRKQQTASDDIGHCCFVPPHGEQLRRRTSSDVSRSSGCPHSTAEVSETGKFWCKDSFVHREQLIQQFGKQDSDFAAGSRLSTCEPISSSYEVASSSEYHQQCSSSSDDVAGDAEPVCCCDTCTLFVSLNSSYRENHPLLPPLADVHNVSNVPTAPSSCRQLSSGGLLPLMHPRFCLPSSTVPVTFSSLVHGKSSSTQTVGSTGTIKEVLHFDEMLCNNAGKDLDTQNLPPMISVSPDGEEGFAVSQRVLQNIRNKPYSEVPPNKTICHIQYKFVNGK